MTSISIIIPAYNEEKNLSRLLPVLAKQIAKDDEIIIVDSQSTDDTARISAKNGARIISMAKLGIGPARTLGAKSASNPVVAFLDADTEPPDFWVSRIKTHFNDPNVEVVGGLDTYKYDNLIENIMYNSYTWIIHLWGLFIYKTIGNCWVPSNNSAFLKRVFLNAGGYRNLIAEDGDMALRLRPKKAVYDFILKVRFSDRRFKEKGFFRTLVLWAISNAEATLNIRRTDRAVNYRK
ncbi:MAG: glycosyltransferase [Candidatus Micrarchaeota archaeon]